MAKLISTQIKRPKGTVLVDLKGKTVECVTLSYLAKLCGVKADTLRRYERAGIFPKANFRMPSKTAITTEGNRLYTKELAMKVAEQFRKIQKPKPVTEDVKQAIRQAFIEERVKHINQ